MWEKLFATDQKQEQQNQEDFFAQLGLLKEIPFGKDSFGKSIQEVKGEWISSALEYLTENKFEGGISSQEVIDFLLETMQGLLSPAYAAVIDLEFLFNPWNSYSAEFGFSFAAVCSELAGEQVISSATKNLNIIPTREALPLDFLDWFGNELIQENLFAGNFYLGSLEKNQAKFEIVYPEKVTLWPKWKQNARIIQEISLRKVLESYFHLDNLSLELLNTYRDKSEAYSFEYQLKWKNGEFIPYKSSAILSSPSSKLVEYLQRKTVVWLDYQNALKALNLDASGDLLTSALDIKKKADREYQKIKNTIQSKEQEISRLKQSYQELEGTISFLSEKKEKLQYESSNWKASKVASDQLKKQAEEMAKMRSAITSTISHELRTPLSSLLGFTELLLSSDFSPQETREFLTTIQTESSRMKDLLDEFLDIQRLESGRIELNLKSLDFNEVLSYIVTSFKGYSSGVNIKTEIESNLPRLKADQGKLEQIMRNFVSNAIKYSPEGGEVLIKAKSDHQFVTICVVDQGLGIPQEALNKLFQQFYRVENESHLSIKGTGVGLNITKQLIEAHSGKVWVESKLSVGSKFFFTIPVFEN